ncbi:peptide methionine sulfoxide reductase [Helicosporidium sp. ATCC 50920]|nr:peptide methionine sulfoxide reductase [Helicosporidium sp. ATCC 50920]|eukprot:KDD75413.1 peptide methionine sulfoxide reductase [Helicosporidium sp. ATCC 50920]
MFDRLQGVGQTAVGYAQGQTSKPTYEQVCSGATGHTEAVQVVYDSTEISFDRLVEAFMHKINPVQAGGQGADHGSQYRSGIYFHSREQEEAASRAVAAIPGCTVEVEPFRCFWPAEVYHQKCA